MPGTGEEADVDVIVSLNGINRLYQSRTSTKPFKAVVGVDVTNDSWGYAWYDKNWKSPKLILENLISTVARGGTYMLNIGPKGDGSIPKEASYTLLKAGEWLKKYPQVVYAADPSPWKHQYPINRRGRHHGGSPFLIKKFRACSPGL